MCSVRHSVVPVARPLPPLLPIFEQNRSGVGGANTRGADTISTHSCVKGSQLGLQAGILVYVGVLAARIYAYICSTPTQPSQLTVQFLPPPPAKPLLVPQKSLLTQKVVPVRFALSGGIQPKHATCARALSLGRGSVKNKVAIGGWRRTKRIEIGLD